MRVQPRRAATGEGRRPGAPRGARTGCGGAPRGGGGAPRGGEAGLGRGRAGGGGGRAGARARLLEGVGAGRLGRPRRATFGERHGGVVRVDGVEDALVADLRLGDDADLAAQVQGA